MPNVGHPDYVPPHRHSALDVQGLEPFLILPEQKRIATAVDTISSDAFTELAESEVTATPPNTFPLWQARVKFQGDFYSGAAPAVDNQVALRLAKDGLVFGREVYQSAPDGPGAALTFPMFVENWSAVIPGGTAVTFSMYWRSVDGATLMTATAGRVMRVIFRPYYGA